MASQNTRRQREISGDASPLTSLSQIAIPPRPKYGISLPRRPESPPPLGPSGHLPSVSDPGSEPEDAGIPLQEYPLPRNLPTNPFSSASQRSSSRGTARPSNRASQPPEEAVPSDAHAAPNPGDPSDPDDSDSDDRPRRPSRRRHDSDFDRLADAISRRSKGKSSSSSVKVRKPDTFDGSEPDKLKGFLVQLALNFMADRESFRDDQQKVTYALSYLKGTAAKWFEPALLHGKWESWMGNYGEFVGILQDNFGVYDEVGTAEAKLYALQMPEGKPIAGYLAEFQELSKLVQWNEEALRSQFYKGLTTSIKNELSRLPGGKPRKLADLKEAVRIIDHRY